MRGASRAVAVGLVTVAALVAGPATGYPLDGARRTGILRLDAYWRARDALLARGTLRPGALRPSAAVRLRLRDHPEFAMPPADPDLSRRLAELLGGEASRYGVALLDLSDPAAPRLAVVHPDLHQSPGSVGKILVALAFFQALADVYPDDPAARERVLRETEVVATDWIRSDPHEVPFWRPGDVRVVKRPIALGDRGNLWTWLDWMLSASSNAAAAQVQAELLLLRHFGREYPVAPERARAYFAETSRAELQRQFRDAMVGPLSRNGLDSQRLRQGSFFTSTGKQRIAGVGSTATAGELLRYLVRLEQGALVDAWSSREIKRLLYLTDRRIRYASHPALDDASVYFKSGSLYSCAPEPGFECRKYHGNVRNYMNSVAIVESEEGGRRLHYAVAVLSNVLRENSAVAHQTLAMRIHRLVASLHAPGARAVLDEASDPLADPTLRVAPPPPGPLRPQPGPQPAEPGAGGSAIPE